MSNFGVLDRDQDLDIHAESTDPNDAYQQHLLDSFERSELYIELGPGPRSDSIAPICSICKLLLLPTTQTVTLPCCNSTFGLSCLVAWADAAAQAPNRNTNVTCPMCRELLIWSGSLPRSRPRTDGNDPIALVHFPQLTIHSVTDSHPTWNALFMTAAEVAKLRLYPLPTSQFAAMNAVVDLNGSPRYQTYVLVQDPSRCWSATPFLDVQIEEVAHALVRNRRGTGWAPRVWTAEEFEGEAARQGGLAGIDDRWIIMAERGGWWVEGDEVEDSSSSGARSEDDTRMED